MGERITAETEGSSRDGHEFRYHLAAGFLRPRDLVLDAACGGGYGAEILQERQGVLYCGVDQDLSDLFIFPKPGRTFIEADLEVWEPKFDFHVGVGFETIEHLEHYSHYISVLKRARRWICVSVPVIPTVHMNPWHKHDFEPGEVVSLFEDDEWRLFQAVAQPSEFSEIYVFCRKIRH